MAVGGFKKWSSYKYSFNAHLQEIELVLVKFNRIIPNDLLRIFLEYRLHQQGVF